MSEEVINLDWTDFRFKHDDQFIDLSSDAITAASSTEFTVLLPETVDGLFELQLVALESDITDLSGNALRQDASVEITIQRQAPTWQLDYSPASFIQPARRIAAMGDSMTYEGGSSYVSVVRDLLSNSSATIDSYAAAGWKVARLTTVWQSQVRDAGYDTLIVFSGVPDLTSQGTTADTIFQSLRGIYEDAIGRGIKVISIGASPWSQYKKSTPELQLQSERLNNLIRQFAATRSAMMDFIDSVTLLGNPGDPKQLRPAYDVGDGLHLVPAGDAVLAKAVAESITRLTTPTSIPQTAILTFSRPVVGLSQAHLQLLEQATEQPIQLVPVDSQTYQLNFSVSATRRTQLRFNLDLTQGTITDFFNRPVREQPDARLSFDYQAPQPDFAFASPAVTSQPMERIRVTFDKAMSSLRSEDFILRRERLRLAAPNLTVNRVDDATFDLIFDSSRTSQSGTYQLSLSPEGGTLDVSGNAVRQGVLITWVKLAVEPSVDAGTLFLPGTDSEDNLEVIVSPSNVYFTINGVETTFPRSDIEHIDIAPGAMRDLVSVQVQENAGPITARTTSTDGVDLVYLFDSPGSDEFLAEPGRSRLSHIGTTQDSFSLLAEGFRQVMAISRAGNDVASLVDSSGSDQFEVENNVAALRGQGFELTAHGFPSVSARSQNGGSDIADLFDTAGNDTLNATMSVVSLQSPGLLTNVTNFNRVNVRASRGTDSAVLLGSSATERFVGQASNSVWSSGAYSRYLYGFGVVEVASQGGTDQATLYDSAGADSLVADARVARLTYANSSQIVTRDFPRTNIYARSGFDTTTFVGREISETFIGQATFSSFASGSFATFAYGFDQVAAIGNGGNDIANLYGSTGDDTFLGQAQTARMFGSGFDNRAVGFTRVTAHSQAGNDSAWLSGTVANETLTASPTLATMLGAGFNNSANNFSRVVAESGGGQDVATLRDGPGSDVFEANPNSATLTNFVYRITASNYSRVNAFASSGIDHAQLTGSSGNDVYTGRPDNSALSGNSFMLFASGFDNVRAAGAGGSDTANFYDSPNDDIATVGYQQASLVGLNFNNQVSNFGRIQLFASLGNDTARLSDSAGNDRFAGSQSSATISSLGFVASLQRFDLIQLLDCQSGLDQVLINSIAYQIVVGAGWKRI